MKVLDIYTDGSHIDKQNNGRLGCGGIAIDKSKPKNSRVLGKFSQELTKDYMKVSYGTDTCSNPTAEMMGVYCALVHFRNIIKTYDKIIVHSDYQGVQGWLNPIKPWKINELYIQRIKNDIQTEISNQNLYGKIEFNWVKGHQTKIDEDKNPDAYWNSKVDSLAKGETEDDK